MGDLLDLQSVVLSFTAQYSGNSAGGLLGPVALDPIMLINRMQVRVASTSLLNQNESSFCGKMKNAYFGDDRQRSVLIGDFVHSDEYGVLVDNGTPGTPNGMAAKYANAAILLRAADPAYNINGQAQSFVLPLSFLQEFFNNSTLFPLSLVQSIEIDLYLAQNISACCTGLVVPAAGPPVVPVTFTTPQNGSASALSGLG
jgi:hypothetical protein